jgi:hypothetical protein
VHKNFTQLDGLADFFAFFYLESCMWLDAISLWIRQRECITFCTDLGKNAAEILTIIKRAFVEESMRGTRVFEWHARFRTDRGRRVRWWVNAHHFSLTSSGLFTKYSS